MQGLHSATPDADLPEHAAAQHIQAQGGTIERNPEMTLFRSLFPRRQTRREAELAYLNAAVSLYDLERREREIAMGKFAA